MKPKELKCPLTWEDRKPCFDDRVFYVPEYYDNHNLWGKIDFSSPCFFGNNHPISVEFCSGNGLWVLEKALASHDMNWIAVEKRFDRVRKIWAKIQNYSLKNMIVVCGKAEDFIDHYAEENLFSHVFVNFPDPWPKDKHAKNRIIKQPFINQLSYVCRKGATATFVTDDETYSEQMIQQMQDAHVWHNPLSAPYYATDWQDYGTSYFDELFRQKGKPIRYMQFINVK